MGTVIRAGSPNAHPHGLSVALLGPDGAGKSTLAAGIQQSFQVPTHVLYMGLGGDQQDGPAWPRKLGRAGRLLTLWGRYLKARYLQTRGHLVIFDRYTYDALLAPADELTSVGRLSRWVRAHACPAPDLAVLLDVPGEVMYQRKGEHSPAHLEDERQRFLALRERIPQMVIIDATRAAELVQADALGHIQQRYAIRGNQQSRQVVTPDERAAVGPIRSAANHLSLRLLPPAGRTWRRWTHRRELDRAAELVPDILSAVADQTGMPLPFPPILRATWTLTDVVVISVAEPGRPSAIVLKLPQSAIGVAALERQAAVLAALLAEQRLGDGCQLLPRPLARGVIDGQFYLAEQALPGREARFILHDPIARQRAHEAAIAGMSRIHRQTASTVTVDRALLECWVDLPIATIRRSIASSPMPAGQFDRSIQAIAHGLHSALLGRTVQTGWIHGDFWVSNLLVTDGADRLTGIVDWDRAAPNELPVHDLLQLLIQTRRLMARQPEIREAMRDLLTGGDWTPGERRVIEAADLPALVDPDDRRVMLLLFWLRYLANYLTQYPMRGRDQRWVNMNIGDIL